MNHFPRTKTLLAAIVLLSPAAVSSSRADIVVNVYPTLAPNRFGSPSYDPWVANSISALQSGSSSAGTPGAPTFYQQLAPGLNLPTATIVVTNFPSWRGNADPVGTFGAAYANEIGNRLLFSLTIQGTLGTTFSISQLSFTASSSDPGNQMGFTFAAGSYQYGIDYVGINYGADHLPGGVGVNADTIITSGPNNQLVDVLFGRGSGAGLQALSSDPGATNQERIDLVALAAGSFTFTGTYTIGGVTGSSFENFNVIPEPGVVALLLAAFAAAAGRLLVRSGSRRPAPVPVRSAPLRRE